MPETSRVEVLLPNGMVEHKYIYVRVAPIPARRVERIPFSHPREIYPLLRVPPPRSLLIRYFVNGKSLISY